MRKSHETTHSFFHDPDFEEASLLLLTEPYASLNSANLPVSVPLYHTKWQSFFPSHVSLPITNRVTRAPFRSMIWAANGQKVQQVPIHHPDITAVILSLQDRAILMVSVYIPYSTSTSDDEPRLTSRLNLIQETYIKIKESTPNLELVVSGDFNRWDTLWGGNQLASHPRQGEGRAIVGFLSELDLQLLLPRGTITYTGNSRGGASTIDLVMSTSRLFSERVSCKPHGTEHGSDHLAIVTKFLIDAPEVALTPRRLYKNAKWEVLNGYVKDHLASIERIDPVANLDEYTTKLTKVVTEGIELSVPIAKPSPYNKRWWTEELSQLRKRYTVFRNQARRRRRNNQRDNTVLYSVAKAAKQDYHSALRKQKKQHWEEFLDEPGNIWDTCRYINDNPNIANFAPISALQTSINVTINTNSEIA